MTITYRGLVTRTLFIRAQWLHVGWRLLILLAFPAMFIVLIAIGWLGTGSAPIAKRLTAVATSFLWVPFMLALFWWQWRRLYERSPYLKEPLWGSVTDEMLEVHGPTGDSKVPWDHFVKIRKSKDLCLLYRSPVLFNLLARQFFASAQDWSEAVAIVQAKTNKATTA
jgi:hypothetical protein